MGAMGCSKPRDPRLTTTLGSQELTSLEPKPFYWSIQDAYIVMVAKVYIETVHQRMLTFVQK